MVNAKAPYGGSWISKPQQPPKTTGFALSPQVRQLVERDIRTMLQQTGGQRRADLKPKEPSLLDYAHNACGMLTEAERHSLGIGLTRKLIFGARGGMHQFTYDGQPLSELSSEKLNYLARRALGYLREHYANLISRKLAILPQGAGSYLPEEYAGQLDNMLISAPASLPSLETLVRRLEQIDYVLSREINRNARSPSAPPGKTRLYGREQ
ncbi:MAG: hypothetical protein HYT16_02990 [DPANN group archaeon]|nr:hypothetical protein [DPANN group archaeon]